jgi:hypothetical protein
MIGSKINSLHKTILLICKWSTHNETTFNEHTIFELAKPLHTNFNNKNRKYCELTL